MRLLFDQNLSFKLCAFLADVFPESNQVRLLGLESVSDRELWDFARNHDFVLVSKDADLADLADLLGAPPKVIWLRCGNEPNLAIADRLRANRQALEEFEQDDNACIEIY